MTTETERTALEMARSFLASVEMNTDLLERDRSDVLQAIDAALASAPSAPQPTDGRYPRLSHQLMQEAVDNIAAHLRGGRTNAAFWAFVSIGEKALADKADRQPSTDPIAAAVDAHLDPLKDELIAMGRKLAKEPRLVCPMCEEGAVIGADGRCRTCGRTGVSTDAPAGPATAPPESVRGGAQ
jgi:hypothetical protein